MVDYYKYKMSASDEEFEQQSQSGMSKAELRRSNKPIMEKRRRARINQCLDELKSLILEAMKKDPTRHSKLEKADILEMTVKHLQTVQRQQLSTAVATDPAVLTKFRSGFSECATEVSRYVSHLENVEPAVKQRLVSHLNNCVSHLQQVAPFYSHYVPYMPERLYPEVKVGFQTDFQNGDENNNGSARIQIPSGVQLIPSRLPTGELALLVPQSAGISANFPFFPPAPESAARIGPSSAFTAVQRSHSPLLSPSTSTSSYDEQYPSVQSPTHQFKIPEQSSSASSKSFSSPETQKPQISSTSDRKSPTTIFIEPIKSDNSCAAAAVAAGVAARVIGSESFTPPSSHSTGGELINGSQILRQPLSVITEKTCNRPSLMKRENLKRHHSDGLLSISEKKTRYQEPLNSTATTTTIAASTSTNNGYFRLDSEHTSASAEDLSGRNNFVREQRNTRHLANAGPSNGDMWRPW
ncbi:protein deadpan-like [Leptopilina heterotoma]|uniref:protein deadpan-like n=1 Tax=Leptopilina heterotoma TaxID=63436 RepID=UPI001CA89689|nr:protein deadpan-like [Leptopilina heterotoma]